MDYYNESERTMITVQDRQFELLRDHRECFNEEEFASKYIDELFDKYDYITGDYSGGLLRLKGFYHNDKEKNYKFIPDYIMDSCAYGCAFYVLKRVKGESKHE